MEIQKRIIFTGIKKKIVALAKSPQHKALARWLDTITRHLYWCARTSDNHGDLILAKWTSITRHICDVHHHPNSLHPACLHGEVQDRLWIEEGESLAAEFSFANVYPLILFLL